ncbi:hypothetical protein BBO99_00005960 [Phytophthora kernoviae]|uniref:Rab-GAP TBC domain-containing protein n=1 Tax=Phytophthora kernoviae TaxID=325452 RepID=A0A3R7FZP7_9STRA|nr:hypothetical protein JM16_005775 [Phytophthora kernoviae]RLN10371.1 hypothetical protein BBI17_006044 [Phytophthora kernoviae]RLN78445.1 hypothetical protein BBO99_00005960 [Phytophthora kernoviae]
MLRSHKEQQRMLDRDVDRTFQQLHTTLNTHKRPNFLAKSFYSSSEFVAWKTNTHQLLSVFLMLKPQIGYCQGMTSLVGMLVQESKMNSEIAFRLFLALTEKYKLDNVYGPDMKDVNLRYFQLDEALRLHLPRLHAHLSDRDIHPSNYASCIIKTPLLRRPTSGEIFAYLSKVDWFHKHKTESDLNRFFATAKAFKISSTFLDVLEGEYSTEASMSMNEYD